MEDYKWYELSEWNNRKDSIKYVVVLSVYSGNYVLIRNRNRTVWELPGGKREDNEQIIQAAGRELYEETGAVKFDLIPYGIYSMNDSFGMVFYANIYALDPLPEYEIAELRFVDELPQGLNYGGIYYLLLDKWKAKKDDKDLNRYSINYYKDSLANYSM